MATINKKIAGAAWKLARKYKAEVGEAESLLQFYYINTLHRNPFDPARGVAEDDYSFMVLSNCVHRVSRELARDARRCARTVSLDELSAKMEEVCDD